MERVILTTGGTGGHIFPALALAEALKKKFPGIRILFIGGQYGPEKTLAEGAGLEFEGLPVMGFLGRGARAIPAAGKMAFSLFKSLGLVKKFSPEAIAGFGGYASFAPMAAARLLGVPALLHEQNAVAGQANHFLALLADKICVSLPQTEGFKKPFTVTGNPVREAVKNVRYALKEAQPRLLVLGGSQGAHALNKFITENLAALKEANVEIRHQTGVKDLAATREAYRAAGLPEEWVQPFFEDMAKMYAWASLALCRAGASTIAELCAVGMPAALVPFPAAIHDHQTINARILADNDAGVLIPEPELGGEKTAGRLIRLLEDTGELERISRNVLALNSGDAALRLAEALESIGKKPAKSGKNR